MDNWPYALILLAPFGYFSFIVPGVYGFMDLPFAMVVLHASIVSTFSDRVKLRHKINAIQRHSEKVSNVISGFTFLFFIPAVLATGIFSVFFFTGKWLS